MIRFSRVLGFGAMASGVLACAIDDRSVSVDGELPAGAGGEMGDGGSLPLSDSSLQVQSRMLDFGRVGTGQAAPNSLVVRNGGDTPLAGLIASVSGSDASEFTAVVDDRCASLSVGATCVVNVAFVPSGTGLRSASLRLEAVDAVPIEVLLSGTGAPPGVLSGDTGGIDFGGQETGVASAPRTWVIRNSSTTATGPLRVQAPAVPDFIVNDGTCTGALAPEQSCQLSVAFRPTQSTVFNDSVTVDDGVNQASLTLVGRGQVRLTIERVGTGTGRVTGPGIDCTSSCSALLDGGRVELTAITQNQSNSYFAGFVGASSCEGPARTCSVQLDSSLTLGARFSLQTNNLIFIASGAYAPNLGGAAAFDAECNRLASAAGLNDATGTGFVAAVSDTASFWDRIPAGVRGWMRMDGLPFGDQRESMRVDPPAIHYSVQFDEMGVLDDFGGVWTGTSSTGFTSSSTCSGWTDTSADALGVTGSGRNGPRTFGYVSTRCDSAAMSFSNIYSMLCMGKTKTAPLAVVPFTGKRMWLTDTPYLVGSMTPDEKCRSERPAGVADARAFIGYTGRYAADLLDPDATYVRPDGHLVGTRDQIAGLRMLSGIWISANGSVVPLLTQVWTADVPAIPGGPGPNARQTCSDWTDPAGEGAAGEAGNDAQRGFLTAVGQICNATIRRLYCFEP